MGLAYFFRFCGFVFFFGSGFLFLRICFFFCVCRFVVFYVVFDLFLLFSYFVISLFLLVLLCFVFLYCYCMISGFSHTRRTPASPTPAPTTHRSPPPIFFIFCFFFFFLLSSVFSGFLFILLIGSCSRHTRDEKLPSARHNLTQTTIC